MPSPLASARLLHDDEPAKVPAVAYSAYCPEPLTLTEMVPPGVYVPPLVPDMLRAVPDTGDEPMIEAQLAVAQFSRRVQSALLSIILDGYAAERGSAQAASRRRTEARIVLVILDGRTCRELATCLRRTAPCQALLRTTRGLGDEQTHGTAALSTTYLS